ncbi:DOCK8 [Cordylochernes scorpioides]|uniref:DOCK8 n=1 Tax=Cordylochernes scorpioides TaxID=51811 RepID=A0ABY6KBL4_9ARAC|nr:DOCK8 [Cordylochernes scorpioides]
MVQAMIIMTDLLQKLLQLCDVDPVRFEDLMEQYQESCTEPILLDFPQDDLEVGFVPRRCRTIHPVMPENE